MGKKSKANKLAKMSEEERARYMQMRADIEEEARRRKVQLISLFMKNKLKREEAFCRLNLAKINQEWRSILRQIKVQELRKEMAELQKFFQEALDRKNRIIERLLSDLDVAENMYATMQHAQMELINKLIGLHQQRIQFLKDVYDSNKAEILAQYEEDYTDFQQKRIQALEQLDCVKCQLDDVNKKQNEEREERHQLKLDDLKSDAEISIERITQLGEVKLQKHWQEYQNVLADYMRYTEGFYAEYMDLKERDEESTNIIRANCREIERASDQLAHLKMVHADDAERNSVKEQYLLKVRGDLQQRLAESKASFEHEFKADEERFKLMSVSGYQTLKHLKRIAADGETLLQLVAICKKYETEHEQLAPLGLPPLPRPMFVGTPQKQQQLQAQKPDSDSNAVMEIEKILEPPKLNEHSFANWLQRENFWRRVNNARVDVICLKRQKKSLVVENARLKAQLQEHLINLNLSNGSNLHVNEFLARRPTSMRVSRMEQQLQPEVTNDEQLKCHRAKTAGGQARRSITACVEANFTAAVRSERMLRAKPKLAKIETFVNCF